MLNQATGGTTIHKRGENNSVAYTEKPDSVSFMREWMALVESKWRTRCIQ